MEKPLQLMVPDIGGMAALHLGPEKALVVKSTKLMPHNNQWKNQYI